MDKTKQSRHGQNVKFPTGVTQGNLTAYTVIKIIGGKIMKEIKEGKKVIREFESLWEFFEYIQHTPTNYVFSQRKNDLSSHKGSEVFTQTKSYGEAVQLMQNGWESMAKQIETRLASEKRAMQPTTKLRPQYSMQGYQASVPRYLQGMPDSMISKKHVPVKQKVVTINKDITYAWHVTTEQIIEQSVKALALAHRMEAQGIRCNINIVIGLRKPDRIMVLKVRIKSAGQKMNVSKVAFPMVHPSMLRRLIFRYIETAPEVTQGFKFGYGECMPVTDLKTYCNSDNEYFIPRDIVKDIDKITTLDELR